MRISKYKFIAKIDIYVNFKKSRSPCGASLKIHLLGELPYNPERVFTLEQAGHQLYGIWLPTPVYSFSTVGPLPFGHTEDIPLNSKLAAVGLSIILMEV